MREIPAAIVESARPPLRPAFRNAIIVAVVAVAGGVAWQLIAPMVRSDATRDLEARQDKARASVGSGLDGLFAHQLDVGNTSIELAMSITGDTQSGYTAANCSTGFDNAFSDALGPGVVSFSTVAIAPVPSSRLEVAAAFEWTGQFRLPNSYTAYTGLEMHADMTFLGKTVHADVVPVADPQFKHYELGVSLAGAANGDIDAGVIQRACRQAAYTLLEELTTWKRPPPPPRPDPVKECESGYHCVDNAEVFVAFNRSTAARLYGIACDRDKDGYACLHGADVEMELSKGLDDHRARAHALLDGACGEQLSGTCAAAAGLALVPVRPGEPASAQQRHEALFYDIRGCDIGSRMACEGAAELLADTPFADAASFLTSGKPATSNAFGTIFGFQQGSWATRAPTTMWVTRLPARVPDGTTVTPVPAGRVPWELHPPKDADTVYAITIVSGPAARGSHRE